MFNSLVSLYYQIIILRGYKKMYISYNTLENLDIILFLTNVFSLFVIYVIINFEFKRK